MCNADFLGRRSEARSLGWAVAAVRASLLVESRITWHDVGLWRRIDEVEQDLVGNADRDVHGG